MSTRRRPPPPPEHDVFLSHSSVDRRRAATLGRALAAQGVRVWIDDTNIRFGRLLGRELQDAIRSSRRVVLLWSAAASRSPWVTVEWLTALTADRLVVPCRLDDTPLPPCLGNALRVDLTRWRPSTVARLAAQLRDPTPAGAEFTAAIRGESADLAHAVRRIADRQAAALGLLDTDARGAARANREADRALAAARRRWPLDVEVLNLAGYQAKNDFLVEQWDAVQAGRWPRKHPALDAARLAFVECLGVDPTNPSALNGLANVLFFQREHAAARWFNAAALERAAEQGTPYPDAEADARLFALPADGG